MNRYSEWNEGESYIRRDCLYANQDILWGEDIRCITKHWCTYSFIIHKYDEDSEKTLDYDDLTILALLSIAGFLTINQLRAFLLLRGYQMNIGYLRDKLEQLICYGMIAAYEFNGENLCDKDGKPKSVDVYTPTYRGSRLAGRLGATRISRQDEEAVRDRVGRKGEILTFLYANQIVLNQLLFRPGLERFGVGRVYRIKGWKTIVIPLELVRNGKLYIIDMLGDVNRPEEVPEKMARWSEYADRGNRYFTLIFLCSSPEHERWVSGMIQQNASDKILLGTTSREEWLKPLCGKVSLQRVPL